MPKMRSHGALQRALGAAIKRESLLYGVLWCEYKLNDTCIDNTGANILSYICTMEWH